MYSMTNSSLIFKYKYKTFTYINYLDNINLKIILLLIDN